VRVCCSSFTGDRRGKKRKTGGSTRRRSRERRECAEPCFLYMQPLHLLKEGLAGGLEPTFSLACWPYLSWAGGVGGGGGAYILEDSVVKGEKEVDIVQHVLKAEGGLCCH
jgi:hypothetical protein